MSEEYDYSLLKKCGIDVFISKNVEIKRPHLVEIGNHVSIDSGFYCTTALGLKDYIHIAPYVSVIGGKDTELFMGNFTTIAAGCRLICASDEHLGFGLVSPVIPDQYRDRVISSPIIMEKFSSLGSNVVVVPGCIIREGCVIGANSFVSRTVAQEWAIYAGSPVKYLKNRPSENMIQYAKELGYG